MNVYLYRVFYISLFSSIIIGFLYLFLCLHKYRTTFCDSNPTNQTAPFLIYNGSNSKCQKCPVFANCSHGSYNCDPNFIKLGYYCIYNDSDSIFVLKMLETTHDILRKQAGLSLIQESRDFVSSDELENLLLDASQLNGTNFYRVLNKTLQYLHNDTSILTETLDNTTVYISKDLSFDLSSRIRLWVYQNINQITIFSVVLAILTYLYWIYDNYKREKQEIDSYYSGLVRSIKRRNGRPLTRGQLLVQLDHMSNNQGSILWPKLEQKLKRTQLIQCFNQDVHPSFRYLK